jgi:murein DD-endopeptidase MepM/ murein hydrolase activator NlpD
VTITDIQNIQAASSRTQEPKGLREAAEQFEAILLNQLTSALAKTEETEGEEPLFGGDGGSGLAKQMFAEQMAVTMAQSGGVGLADLIVQRSLGRLPNGPTTSDKPHASIPGDAKHNFSAMIEKGSKELPRASDLFKTKTVGEVPSLAKTSSDDGLVTMTFPAKGRISSGFGNRFHPIDKKAKFHGGIDIAVPRGTPVKAAADGVVKFAGWRGGYGYAVVVEHTDGSETLYAHNDKLLVEKGQEVDAGDQLSLSGSTGKSTGPHLHFEVRLNGTLVNPMKYLTNVLGRTADR